MQKIFCTLFLLLLLVGCSEKRSEQTIERGKKILFILVDSSTTRTYQEVMKRLDKEGKDYSILAFNVAAELLKGHPKLLQLPLQQKPEPHWTRLKPLNDYDLHVIRNYILNDREIGILMTGVSLFFQVQILKHLEEIPRIVFYDHFHIEVGDHRFILNEFFRLRGRTTLLVTLEDLKRDLLYLSPMQDVRVVGQPLLHEWIEAKKDVPSGIIEKLGPHYNPTKKTILYFGDYERNENTYPDALKLFFRSVVGRDENIVVATHPSVDGAEERALFKDMKNAVVIPNNIVSRKYLMYAVNQPVIVTQRLSVAVQAFFAGFPVIYLDPIYKGYTNFLIKHNEAFQCFTEEDFRSALDQVQTKAPRQNPESLFQKYNIPQDSVERIFKIILEEEGLGS